MKHYERRLPHWDSVGQAIFVTFRLRGSLPAQRVFPPGVVSSGQAFVVLDRILDRAAIGPRYLAMPEIATLVAASVSDGDRGCGHYTLHSFVVMPNHVRMLVTSHVTTARWLNSLKGATARRANLVLGLTGKAFWQDESYDHLVRSDEEFGRIRRYIENNPVKAGLASAPNKFLWSSASHSPIAFL